MTYAHLGLERFRLPQWAFEGLADYVGIENREPFEVLREALGDRTVDIPMMVQYVSYPPFLPDLGDACDVPTQSTKVARRCAQ